MHLSLYDTSVPVIQQMLASLSGFLHKAEEHAQAHAIEAQVFLQARLFPDMFPLIRQVQIACDFAKSVTGRLANQSLPIFEDTEVSFTQLQERIQKTIDFINTLKPDQFIGAENRALTTAPGTPYEQHFDGGQAFLLYFGLPHFFFHTTTAYNILRHHGVAVGKRDFIGAALFNR
jgi:hypothetical protein